MSMEEMSIVTIQKELTNLLETVQARATYYKSIEEKNENLNDENSNLKQTIRELNREINK